MLEDIKVPVRLRLAGLWTSLMFCYVYGDYFGLFVPDHLRNMLAGNFGPMGPTTNSLLIGVSVMMAIPALMVFGSMALPAAWCRWGNIVLGVVYAVIIVMTLPGAAPFYVMFGVLEIALSLFTIVTAWRWPRLKQA